MSPTNKSSPKTQDKGEVGTSTNKGTKALDDGASAVGSGMDVVTHAARDVVNVVDQAARGVASSVNNAIDSLTKKTP